jgi:hypothetical protein
MPVRMEALGRVCVGMERVRARRRRSAWVVALFLQLETTLLEQRVVLPEWISDD